MLEPDSCYILGTPQGPAAYVWKGKESSAEERKVKTPQELNSESY